MTNEDKEIIQLLLKRTHDRDVPWRVYAPTSDTWTRRILVARAAFGRSEFMFEIVYQPWRGPIIPVGHARYDRLALNIRDVVAKTEVEVRAQDSETEELLNELYLAASQVAEGDQPDPEKKQIIEALQHNYR